MTATGSPIAVDSQQQPLRYQWLHGGIPLEGEVYSTLPLLSVTTHDAGAYQVVVTDFEGSRTSAVARVVVSLTESPPLLSSSTTPNRRGSQGTVSTWLLHGDSGRYYVLESSSDLVHWRRQPVDAVSPTEWEPLTDTTAVEPGEKPSHVRIRQEPFEFQVSTEAEAMFLRARHVEPVDAVRSLALWILQYAKEDWGRDPRWRWRLTDSPSERDVASRIHPDLRPILFAGANECQGQVVIGTLGAPPVWPCVPIDPLLWDLEAYSMVNPRLVWNPPR
ncbi:MAG: hypothetical protein HYR88_14070 [Verrucomicrobia bacterium]|nr:hypothetical protein [Verrucomicrobiota bacterium]MBI3867292.1 hypothetical protein [Verrucomicrobiota bacterium]